MRGRSSFEYAVIRVVPHVERGEFINAGIVLYCRARSFLDARIALDEARLRALAPGADPAEIMSYLEALQRICQGGSGSGPIGQLTQRERFHWVIAPRSTVIQTSPAHAGLCQDPAVMLHHLMATVVQVATS
ncbi:MAG TPA: DUF3037 domain-containing protein [Ktedonobacterales bacterium]|nr:DUF3037 domain-containing protein [Ktedonobacterales bacterium]